MKKSILVVEDEADMQRLYEQMLESDYDVIIAGDTNQAWKALAKNRVDLIILDIILPKGATGDEFFLQLGQHPDYHSIPVVFSTVIDDRHRAQEAQNVSDAGYLTKPFTREELHAKITDQLALVSSAQRP